MRLVISPLFNGSVVQLKALTSENWKPRIFTKTWVGRGKAAQVELRAASVTRHSMVNASNTQTHT